MSDSQFGSPPLLGVIALPAGGAGRLCPSLEWMCRCERGLEVPRPAFSDQIRDHRSPSEGEERVYRKQQSRELLCPALSGFCCYSPSEIVALPS